jgi:hypothetical protein
MKVGIVDRWMKDDRSIVVWVGDDEHFDDGG